MRLTHFFYSIGFAQSYFGYTVFVFLALFIFSDCGYTICFMLARALRAFGNMLPCQSGAICSVSAFYSYTICYTSTLYTHTVLIDLAAGVGHIIPLGVDRYGMHIANTVEQQQTKYNNSNYSKPQFKLTFSRYCNANGAKLLYKYRPPVGTFSVNFKINQKKKSAYSLVALHSQNRRLFTTKRSLLSKCRFELKTLSRLSKLIEP